MKNSKNILIIVLLLLLTTFLVYNFNISKENDTYRKAIEDEKISLKKELDLALQDLNLNEEQKLELSKGLDEANKSFSKANRKLRNIRVQLRESKAKVESLKKKLEDSEEGSFKALQALRTALEEVKINNKVLFQSLDSIKTVNDSLIVTIAVTKSELNAEKLQTTELVQKLSDAAKVQIARVRVFAIETKKSGEIKETNRYRKATGFQVTYNVLNNKILANKKCDIFYVLRKQQGSIVKSNGEFLCKGVLKEFTDGARLVLSGETMPVSETVSLKDISFEKGIYTVEIYSFDGLLAKETFELKGGFLNVF